MKSEKGQSLVEFALVLPLLVLLLFGIIDFGRIFHAYLTIDHAGRESARAASIGGKTVTEIQQVAINAGESINLANPKGTIQVIPDSANPFSTGTNVEILIEYPIDFLTPIIGDYFNSNFTLTNTTVMRVE